MWCFMRLLFEIANENCQERAIEVITGKLHRGEFDLPDRIKNGMYVMEEIEEMGETLCSTLSMDDYETMVKLVVPQNKFIAYELLNIGDEYYKPYGISYIDCFENKDY